MERTSIILRRLGKIIATGNAIWIIATCMFQFSKFYDRCYCNGSVLGLGASKAYIIMKPDRNWQADGTKSAWIGGVFLAAGSVIIYMTFVNLFINPELPDWSKEL
jgi:hypothetical protein